MNVWLKKKQLTRLEGRGSVREGQGSGSEVLALSPRRETLSSHKINVINVTLPQIAARHFTSDTVARLNF